MTAFDSNAANIYALHEQWSFDQTEENLQNLLYSVDVGLLVDF